ncbi:unannotated protein [freshwater metagenome]|uniref:Unannotated protein n=1 Tax=freshwater metagenome TaxID=449393 RepID=A0A6J7L6N3_9ZZZZ
MADERPTPVVVMMFPPLIAVGSGLTVIVSVTVVVSPKESVTVIVSR